MQASSEAFEVLRSNLPRSRKLLSRQDVTQLARVELPAEVNWREVLQQWV